MPSPDEKHMAALAAAPARSALPTSASPEASGTRGLLLAVNPAAVTPETSFAVLGLPPPRFRRLVRDLDIPCIRQGKTLIARVEDVLAAITKSALATETTNPNTADGVLAELGLRRRGGAR